MPGQCRQRQKHVLHAQNCQWYGKSSGQAQSLQHVVQFAVVAFLRRLQGIKGHAAKGAGHLPVGQYFRVHGAGEGGAACCCCFFLSTVCSGFNFAVRFSLAARFIQGARLGAPGILDRIAAELYGAIDVAEVIIGSFVGEAGCGLFFFYLHMADRVDEDRRYYCRRSAYADANNT